MKLNENELQSILGDLSLNEAALAGLVNLVEGHVKKALKENEDELEATKGELEEKKKSLKETEDELEATKGELDEAKKKMSEDNEAFEKEKEELKEHAQRYADSVRDSVTSRVNDYMAQAVKEFITENEDRFKALEDYTRMKGIFENVKGAFEQHGFPLNESTALDNMRKEVRDSKMAYDSLFEDLVKTRQELDTAKMAIIFENASRELTDTQKEKLKTLSESVQFSDSEEFQSALALLVEQVMTAPSEGVAQRETLNESFLSVPKTSTKVSPTMEAILKALG